jgi:hypothetical protein
VTCGSPRATSGWEAGAGAAGTRGGPGAAPSREVRARAVGTCGSPRAAPNLEVGAVVLTRSLYVGVPGPQGTDSGPWAHLERGCEPTGGANILSLCSLSESLYVGILKRWRNMADTW